MTKITYAVALDVAINLVNDEAVNHFSDTDRSDKLFSVLSFFFPVLACHFFVSPFSF